MTPGEIVDGATRTDQDLTHALQAAKADLAAIEEENQRVHFEYQLMLKSKGRRAFMRANEAVRTAAAGLIRPLDGLDYIYRGVAARTGLAPFGRVVEHVRFQASPLRSLPMLTKTSDQADASQAVRWIGQAGIRGVVRHALLCEPAASAEFRIQAAPGSRLVASCASRPQGWPHDHRAVEFTVTARSAEGGWERTRTLRLDPARRLRDRGWRTIRMPLPIEHAETVEVILTTRAAGGERVSDTQALWGDPRIERSRAALDLMRGVRAELQRFGVRGTLRKVRQLRAVDAEADLYARWVASHTPGADALKQMAADAAALPYQPLISIITPVYNTDPVWLRACIDSVRKQVYPHWELCLADDASDSAATVAVLREYAHDPRIKMTRLQANSHISAASNAALSLATGEFVAMLDHDDELAPDALFEVARYLGGHRDADMIYSDEDKLDVAGRRCDPHFKPDWSPDHFLSYMYTCHLMVLRRALVESLGGFRVGYEGAQDYDLALRVIGRTAAIHHIPKVLYQWRKIPGSAAAELEAKPWALKAARRALEDHVRERSLQADVLAGEAPGLFRVRFRIEDQPLVTIVLPTDDRSKEVNGRVVPLLPNCMRSVLQKTAYANYEFLVVDNGRVSEATLAFLRTVPHRRVSYSYEGAFNFAHKLNFAVGHARGSHLVVFNDDLEVISSEWLTAMLEYSQQPEVGVVGAKLLFPDGRLQHIGIVLGVCGVAAHAFHTHPGWSFGYAGSAVVPRNYSAVTGACMMTRRDIFGAVGGFNEQLAIDYNDVDYCLRVRRAGYRVVFTPYAQLFHFESGSFGSRVQDPAEMEQMRQVWGPAIDRDPFYNPNLTRDFPDYRLRLD